MHRKIDGGNSLIGLHSRETPIEPPFFCLVYAFFLLSVPLLLQPRSNLNLYS